MKTVHVIGGDYMVARMFEDRGFISVPLEQPQIDLLCFTGGADVHPAYYRDVQHRTTHTNPARDEREKAIFDKWVDKIPMVGICRGSQFLNVMSGGTLWQDVDQHAIGGTHKVIYHPEGSYDFAKAKTLGDYQEESGTVHECTSTHHQMMRVDQKTAQVWGYCFLSHYRDQGEHRQKASSFNFSPDIEIVKYDHTNVLCFQPHPEYGVKSCEDLFFTCLKRAFG